MIQGMTGFAERTFASGSLRFKVSIKSLNHRFFDWGYKGAPLGDLENRLRAVCQKRIQRGRIEVFADLAFLDPGSWNFAVNTPLLEKVLQSLDGAAARLGRTFDFSLDQMLKIPQIVEISRQDLTPAQTAWIEARFRETLDDVVRQRRLEGERTVRQLGIHVRRIEASVVRIEKLFQKQPAAIRRKLRRRVLDLNSSARVSEEKLAEETAFLMQRYDLGEEILRLKSHLQSLKDLLSPRASGPIGKKLDFLAQEITREANTLGSKSQAIELVKEGLAIKNEVETIRQHGQNIE